ncbi:MAG: YceI family protein [Halobacteria archaeon]|nr:YceI family protein [Halobacteria archaeon]
MFNIFKHLVTMIALLAIAGTAPAEEQELCESFMDGRVDESLLAGMLSAAEDGHLFRIKPGSSQVGFCVESKLRRIEGSFSDFRGGMALGAGEGNNGQTLVLIRADSLDTQGALVRNLLKSENFFDVERYPDVLFISNRFYWTGKQTAVLKGDLTLRGITRPINFAVTVTPMDDRTTEEAGTLEVKATATINRADFGMDQLDNFVDGDVTLCMTVQAQKYEKIGLSERGRSSSTSS